MLPLLFSLIGFYLVCLAVVVVWMIKAPTGYEDARGFHVAPTPAPLPKKKVTRKTSRIPFFHGLHPAS